MGKHSINRTGRHAIVATGIAAAIAVSIAAAGNFGEDGSTAPTIRPTATATQNGPVSDADTLADAPTGSYLTPYSGELGDAMQDLYEQTPRTTNVTASPYAIIDTISADEQDTITLPGIVLNNTPKEEAPVTNPIEELATESATTANTTGDVDTEETTEPDTEAPILSGTREPAGDTIESNMGTIDVNTGTVEINTVPGTIIQNQGHVTSNIGFIAENTDTGVIANNNGYVETNYGTITQGKYGYVHNNYGTVYGGRVANNYGQHLPPLEEGNNDN